MNKEELVKEAVRRMKMLGLGDKVIDGFAKDHIISCSSQTGFSSYPVVVDIVLTDVPNNTLTKYINNFEKEYNCMVYHVIEGICNFGAYLALLFVSEDKDGWEWGDEIPFDYTHYGKGDKAVSSFVYNFTYPDCSEFGDIIVRAVNSGLRRVG